MFGYRSMVAASMVICVMSMTVWLHHFFTMGASADINGFFGIMSMVIGIPTGVKIFNWLFTMYGGRVRFTTPVLWTIGFMVTFVLGGLTGVLLAVPPVDWQVHNSVFLIAHFHHVIVPGVVFGIFAGYTYWFPKAFGFTLDEKWGRRAFWCWFVGFHLAFMPLYVLGLQGMTRRMQHYENLAWQPYLVVAAIGAGVVLLGILCQVIQLVVSIRGRERHRDLTGDPWNGRTLEWATASPPPAWNFAVLPQVTDKDALWLAKRHLPERRRDYEAIDLPKNSALGFLTALFASVGGFALIWHIWWLAALSLLGAFLATLAFAFRLHDEFEVHASELELFDHDHPVGVAV
jgi:cytochrome o ubiquinol oxidase subunit 1